MRSQISKMLWSIPIKQLQQMHLTGVNKKRSENSMTSFAIGDKAKQALQAFKGSLVIPI